MPQSALLCVDAAEETQYGVRGNLGVKCGTCGGLLGMQDVTGEPIGLTPKQLAHRLGVSAYTLKIWRRDERGPPYFRFNCRVYYCEEDVSAWIRAKRTAHEG